MEAQAGAPGGVTNQEVVMSAMEIIVTSLALSVQIQALPETSVHSCLDSS